MSLAPSAPARAICSVSIKCDEFVIHKSWILYSNMADLQSDRLVENTLPTAILLPADVLSERLHNVICVFFSRDPVGDGRRKQHC